MNDPILGMLRSGRPVQRPEAPAAMEADTQEVSNSFGWQTDGAGKPEMLELRLKSGNIGAVAYGWIEFAEFSPSVGITLHARGSQIRITGRNLNAAVREGVRLFEGIVRRRIPWLREADRESIIASPDGATVIESIKW